MNMPVEVIALRRNDCHAFREHIIRVVREKRPIVFRCVDFSKDEIHIYRKAFWRLWALGYPIAVVEGNAESTPPPQSFPALRWSRPLILRTRWGELYAAAQNIARPVSSLEEAPCSSLAVRRAVVDAQLWDATVDMLPAHITRVAIVYGKDKHPLPKADIYLLLSHLKFLDIPDDHVPLDVITFQTRFVRLADVRGGAQWSERSLVACVIDKSVLPQKMIDFYISCCERLRIPVIEPSAEQAGHFKHILYPVSEYISPISIPPGIIDVASAFCIVHTTLKCGNNIPLVCRDFSYARDYELVLHAVNSLVTYQEVAEANPEWLINEWVEFLKYCTYEGILLAALGDDFSNLFLQGDEM